MSRQNALFLDVDGTLVELAATPGDVRIDRELGDLLVRLHAALDGALALVSGRPIEQLDRLFAPLRLPSAGLHGFERRSAQQILRCDSPDPGPLDKARAALGQLVARHTGLLLEDKVFSLAVHFRGAPGLEPVVDRELCAIVAELSPAYRLLRGKMVRELQPRDADKGFAVKEFMTEPPFHGRRPVFIGDDVTDESAIHWVNSVGGLSIAVNAQHETQAQLHLPGVLAVRRWLADLLNSQIKTRASI